MLGELRSLAQSFQDGEKILVGLYEPLWSKLGLTEDILQKEMEKLKA